jgi:hypothetical protein
VATVVDLTPGSPRWWLQRLWKALEDQVPRYNLLAAYQGGDHRLPEGHNRAREAYRQFQRKARSNYSGLVSNAVVERLQPIGFRTGSETTNELDGEAWRIWQANHFDARCGQLLLAATSMSVAYVMVIPNPDDPTTPLWTLKDPRQTITESDPVAPDKIRAGLTWWDDEVDGLRHAWVILPDGIHEFTTKIPRRGGKTDPSRFVATLDDNGDEALLENASNPMVPLVPFVNRPGLDGDGMGEFEDVLDVQDRINSVILDRLVISKMQAYRQRWVKGVDVEDEDGVPQQPFRPGADLIWTVDDPNAAFGDFAPTDLTPLLKAADDDVRDLAAITRTPPHYLMGQMVNVSGDALKAAESGLVSKVRDRMLHYGEAFEQVMRLTFNLRGEDLPVDAEVVWANPEFRTLSELYDAASKAGPAGVPWRSRMELLGHTAQEIARMQTERVEDALLMAAYPQLEPACTPVRYSAAAIPGDATNADQNHPAELTGGPPAGASQP